MCVCTNVLRYETRSSELLCVTKPVIKCLRAPRLSNDSQRFKLESELAQLIVKMTVEGHSAFESGMKDLVSIWADTIFIEEDYCSAYTPLLQSVSFRQVQSENPLTMRVALKLKDIAGRGRMQMSFPAGWLKELIDEEVLSAKGMIDGSEATTAVDFGPQSFEPGPDGGDEDADESELTTVSPHAEEDELSASAPENEDDPSVIQIKESDRKRKRGAQSGAARKKRKRKSPPAPEVVEPIEEHVPSKYKQMLPQNNIAQVRSLPF